MSRYIAARAIRGATALVAEAEAMVNDAIAELGPDTPVAFTNTAYFLPIVYAFTGHKVKTLGDLPPVIERAKSLIHPMPADAMWLPYLGETLDSGVATLFAEEAIEGVRFARKQEPQIIKLGGDHEHGERFTPGALLAHGDKMRLNGPIDDVQLRAWGIQLVDGRMPGFCAIVGCAKSNEVAVKIVRELQSRGILIFLSGNVNGRSIIHQLQEEGIQLGYDTFTVPFGLDTISAVYALGFAARSALTFGGMEAGNARDIMLYNKYRVFAFVLALGEVDDLKYATAAGAISYGFPVIADTRIPQILPTGVTTYEHVVSMPFDEIPGADDMERAEKLIQRAIEVRGVKVKITKVPIPVSYGSAFEGERIRREIMHAEFGGKRSRAFEFLRMRPADDVEDGKITCVGLGLDDVEEGAALALGMVVDVSGRKMQLDFEPIIERQFHYFINGVEGIQHNGQRDIAWTRVSKSTVAKGFRMEHFGKVIHARIHEVFGNIVDKVQVYLTTDAAEVDVLIEEARAAYRQRNERIANLTDESVDTFYSCLLCQSFAPNHVCVVNPERVGLCGAYNWLDCKASFEINPTGPNQPVPKGLVIDPVKGEFSGPNEYFYTHSNQTVDRVAFYSIMEAPMTSCGCFECIMVLVPEANGFMIVSREDPSMTPCGMTFSTLAGTAGGGMQTPGMMGLGKYYLTSEKFISGDGGMPRVVWMSSFLKESMRPALEEICEAAGYPGLLDMIADETMATTVEDLLPILEEKGHPALTLDSLF
ncbi:MAG TPA: acetyl-CoA decarbonylase/synthase complex subunit alpha/beta [Thermoleophilia bacterium]|nr:acetyl-CoA decarbonylase/synthase complex subunit alpha/beta [Thermoleophilia bacterium]